MLTLGVIPKNFPLKLTVKVILVIAAGVAVTGALLYVSSQIWLGESYTEGLKTLSKSRGVILRNSIIIYATTSLFVLAGIIVLGLLYSHRVAGPLYRLAATARLISGGDYRVHVKLRDGDAVHPLADSMNQLVEGCNERLRRLTDALNSLEEASERLEAATEQGRAGDLEEAVDGLFNCCEGLKRSIEDIRL